MGLEYFPLIGCPIQSDDGMDAERFLVLCKIGATAHELISRREEFSKAEGKPIEQIAIKVPFNVETLERGGVTELQAGELIEA